MKKMEKSVCMSHSEKMAHLPSKTGLDLHGTDIEHVNLSVGFSLFSWHMVDSLILQVGVYLECRGAWSIIPSSSPTLPPQHLSQWILPTWFSGGLCRNRTRHPRVWPSGIAQEGRQSVEIDGASLVEQFKEWGEGTAHRPRRDRHGDYCIWYLTSQEHNISSWLLEKDPIDMPCF